MSHKVARISSLYGPVDVALVACDGPGCMASVQEQHMISWWKLSPNGASVQTMGAGPLDDLDFCGFACIQSALTLMTG